ncbi:hypothetical protein [Enterococcus avium]|uniref:hypothetical protein n=1 Tax=Enterococcus avium TaxID=33945 RepID=UPI000F4FF2B2|nr:hypothetical protein [Enterococcus avium]MDT2432220.1 hypothetical protein [Enterococcus avium]MDT2449870.1 hypothetical protein [Enterococcus avium]MDT2493800.1 hypothetical protein [Enterococcus avium]ROZ48241.1 hypothetical protein EGX28_02590 [Enterococcus avium]
MSQTLLKDFAKELGISSQKASAQLEKDERIHYLSKSGRDTYISEEGKQLICDRLDGTVRQIPSSPEKEENTNEGILVATIQETIQAKDQQIYELQRLLAKQQTLLDQQQQLNAEDKKVIRELNDAPKLAAPTPDSLAVELQQQVVEKDTEIQQLKQEIDKLEAINAEWVEGYKKLKTAYQQLQGKKKKWFWKKNT